eukprot:gene14512-16018_t
MDQIFQGLNEVQCYLDDIIVTGKSEEEHMQNLHAVLKLIKEYGLRLRKEKCSFLQESVEYLGHVISSQGIHPSSKKVEAIQKIAKPSNITELKRFLGMVPTAKHGNADGLSRLPSGFEPQFESGHALVDLVEYEVFGTLPVSVDVIKNASKRDAVLSSVIDDVGEGKKLNKNLNFKDGEVIAYSRGEAELIVLFRMKSLTREHFWWPDMNAEIENIAHSCCECQEGPDFGFMWLVVEDAHCKWLEVIKLRTETSPTVAAALIRIFPVQGLPEQLVSDNGSQFTPEEFKKICELRGINDCYVTPYHPRENGLAERFIQTFKKCMNKMAKNNSRCNNGCSSKPIVDGKKEKQKTHHDRTARMREFEVGDLLDLATTFSTTEISSY